MICVWSGMTQIKTLPSELLTTLARQIISSQTVILVIFIGSTTESFGFDNSNIQCVNIFITNRKHYTSRGHIIFLNNMRINISVFNLLLIISGIMAIILAMRFLQCLLKKIQSFG